MDDVLIVPMPEPHTVYLHKSEAGRVLYVGCTKDLKTRTSGHKSGTEAWSPWWPYVATVEIDSIWPDRDSARARERALIRELRPAGNRHHNPDWPCGEEASFDAIVRLLDGDEGRALNAIAQRSIRAVWAELTFADMAAV